MNWQKWIGVGACIILMGACFMHWAYYPDIQKYFTGFDSRVQYKGRWVHYYGRPGFLLCFFGVTGLCFHLLAKNWAKRVNLLLAALCLAYAVKCYFTFSSAYSGFVPVKETGLFLILVASFIHMVTTVFSRVAAPSPG